MVELFANSRDPDQRSGSALFATHLEVSSHEWDNKCVFIDMFGVEKE